GVCRGVSIICNYAFKSLVMCQRWPNHEESQLRLVFLAQSVYFCSVFHKHFSAVGLRRRPLLNHYPLICLAFYFFLKGSLIPVVNKGIIWQCQCFIMQCDSFYSGFFFYKLR